MGFIAAAIGGSALLGAGSSLLGSGSQSKAAGTASWDQMLAELTSIQAQQQAYAQGVAIEGPYRDLGYTANYQLQYGLDNPQASPLFAPYNPQGGLVPGSPQSPVLTQQGFQASPGYNYQLQQAMSAIQNSAAARGSAISGNTLRDLQTNAQGLASQDWWNAYNANSGAYWNAANYYSGLQNNLLNSTINQATRGQAAAAGTAQQAGATGANIGNSLGAYGTAAGAGAVGSANATSAGYTGVANAGQNAVSNYLLSQFLMGNQAGTAGTNISGQTAGGYMTSSGQGFDLSNLLGYA